MKALVLLLWAACLLTLGAWAIRLVWLASPWERLLTLALLGTAALSARPIHRAGSARPGPRAGRAEPVS